MHIDNVQMITIIVSILVPTLSALGFIINILFKFEGRFLNNENRFSSIESRLAKIESDTDQLKTMMNTIITYLLDQKTGTYDKKH